jgi:hypothetical protein
MSDLNYQEDGFDCMPTVIGDELITLGFCNWFYYQKWLIVQKEKA